ncbi:MAG: hypothetical protein HGA23_06945, partial [Bacteroidales bacterium]|nr:hypothetical protein [Bacteroidales bacterium]
MKVFTRRQGRVEGNVLGHHTDNMLDLIPVPDMDAMRGLDQEEMGLRIGPIVTDGTQALSVGMQINTWVAVSGVTGDVTIPEEILVRIHEYLTSSGKNIPD